MHIQNTSEYLKVLDEIADIIDKDNPTPRELNNLKMMQLAVKYFEFDAIRTIPAKDMLIQNFLKMKFLQN